MWREVLGEKAGGEQDVDPIGSSRRLYCRFAFCKIPSVGKGFLKLSISFRQTSTEKQEARKGPGKTKHPRLCNL